MKFAVPRRDWEHTPVNSVTLRQAGQGDSEFLFRVHREAMTSQTSWGGILDEATCRQKFQAGFSPANRRVIQCDGRDVGTVGVQREPGRLYLSYFAILPEHQRHGIGAQVLEGVKREAKKAGLPVRLMVQNGAEAEHFYEMRGFRIVEETPVYDTLEWMPEKADGPLASLRKRVSLKKLPSRAGGGGGTKAASVIVGDAPASYREVAILGQVVAVVHQARRSWLKRIARRNRRLRRQ